MPQRLGATGVAAIPTRPRFSCFAATASSRIEPEADRAAQGGVVGSIGIAAGATTWSSREIRAVVLTAYIQLKALPHVDLGRHRGVGCRRWLPALLLAVLGVGVAATGRSELARSSAARPSGGHGRPVAGCWRFWP